MSEVIGQFLVLSTVGAIILIMGFLIRAWIIRLAE